MVSLHGEDPKVERPAARGLGASPRALFISLSRAERGRRPTTSRDGAGVKTATFAGGSDCTQIGRGLRREVDPGDAAIP